MAKFAIVATFQIAPGRTDEFLSLLSAHRERCLRDEPGTLQFDILQPHNEPNKVMAYEVYVNEAAFQTHWNGPHIARIRAEAKDTLTKLTGIRCSVSS